VRKPRAVRRREAQRLTFDYLRVHGSIVPRDVTSGSSA
jgi:hypothetical protein